MEKMLTEVCHEVNNYFRRDSIRKNFSVDNGSLIGIPDGFLQEGQYFLLEGSIFNDGVHKWLATGMNLRAETEFSGNLWSLAIPPEFIDLVAEISAWNERYGGADSAAMSPFSSESFGGYSYAKSGSGRSSEDVSEGSTWKDIFAPRLSKWRRKRGIV